MNDHERIDKLEDRQLATDKVVFNGLQKTCVKMEKWLDEKAPHLLTREEHATIDATQALELAEANRQIGRKKDRRLVALGIAVPALTVIILKVWESI